LKNLKILPTLDAREDGLQDKPIMRKARILLLLAIINAITATKLGLQPMPINPMGRAAKNVRGRSLRLIFG
jgi:hypothetical protein